jgi:hypothetical protein
MTSPPSEDPWLQAVQAGDVIRRRVMAEQSGNIHGFHPQNSAFLPPGVGQGVVAAAGTALLTWPLRRGLFRLMKKPNNPQFQIFLELVVTPLQALAVVQAGLLVGSVYGSHFYLQQFRAIQQEQQKRALESSFVKDICQELLPHSWAHDTTTTNRSNNATIITGWSVSSQQLLHTYREVLQNCQTNE